MKEEHIHNLYYNEAKEYKVNNKSVWAVLRFCPQCGETEYVVLKEPN